MNCQRAQETYLDSLGGARPRPGDVDGHLASCEDCREELQGLAATWNALGGLPLLEPSSGTTTRLYRRLRWARARETLVSVEGWQTAALAGVVGFVLSVLLALVVPYETMVDVCRRVVTAALPGPGAYVLAGIVYGLVPMAIAGAFPARKADGAGVVYAVEAAAVFLVVLAPYIVLRCSEFPLALFAGFLTGIAAGAVAGGSTAIWLGRRRAWA